jgi:hypothetical protein
VATRSLEWNLRACSFSRVSKNNSWTLEEKAPEIVHLTLDVLEPSRGALFFTNHSTASTSDVVRNIALDLYNDKGVEISVFNKGK